MTVSDSGGGGESMKGGWAKRPERETEILGDCYTHVVEDAAVGVRGGGHGRGAPVRILQIQKRRSTVHGFQNLGGTRAGC